MTDIHIPVPITDLFAAFGISDPSQMLIIFLSLILGVTLVLIILIAFRGRPAGNSESPNQIKPDIPSAADEPTLDPVISVSHRSTSDDASVTQHRDNTDIAAGATEQLDDFQIFKRSKKKSSIAIQSASSLKADDQMSTADYLRLIEKEMVRLRDLYQGGHITRDMYIDETRSLYHQARGLTSVS